MTRNRINIAVIAGDGIGTEVVPEGLRSFICMSWRDTGLTLHGQPRSGGAGDPHPRSAEARASLIAQIAVSLEARGIG